MAKDTHNRKTSKLPVGDIPQNPKIILPYNGVSVTTESLSFSLACFDREHELFNLGDQTETTGVVSGKWFLDLLDCLKSVSNKKRIELYSGTHDLHRVNWSTANTSPPSNSEQLEYWQFRINKTRGRVIGFIITNIFYVVWLDPFHNFTDIEGYEKALKKPKPSSEYENIVAERDYYKNAYEKASTDLDEFLAE